MSSLPTLKEIEHAATIVYRQMPPTPEYQWPALNRRIAVDLWLKHENHTPLTAFKIRGGIVYFELLSSEIKKSKGVICATRGNHGQSIARAAAAHDIATTIVVPIGNSREKNEMMIALGANLVEHGSEFQESLEFARTMAHEKDLHLVPSFHPFLVGGVATYSLELFRSVSALDVMYVPIGLGSGICGAIATRNGLGLETEIVGVVSSQANAYAESFAAGRLVERPVSTTIADGMACRRPNEESLTHIFTNVSRIVEVSDDEVRQAIRDIYQCTHNVAEGAGAAAVAAVTKDAGKLDGKRVSAVLCGGNIDSDVFADVLAQNCNRNP